MVVGTIMVRMRLVKIPQSLNTHSQLASSVKLKPENKLEKLGQVVVSRVKTLDSWMTSQYSRVVLHNKGVRRHTKYCHYQVHRGHNWLIVDSTCLVISYNLCHYLSVLGNMLLLIIFKGQLPFLSTLTAIDVYQTWFWLVQLLYMVLCWTQYIVWI